VSLSETDLKMFFGLLQVVKRYGMWQWGAVIFASFQLSGFLIVSFEAWFFSLYPGLRRMRLDMPY